MEPDTLRALPKVAAENDLSFQRKKPRVWLVSVGYQAMRLARWCVGPRRLLRACLVISWLFRRFALELCFDVFGDSFHDSTMGVTDELLKEWIPQGGSVIDVGCGHGRWCHASASHASMVVGIDNNRKYIETAKKNYQNPRVIFIYGRFPDDLDQHGLVGRTFDLALLIHVLEHIDDVDQLLQSVSRVTETVVVEVPDFESDSLNVVRHVYRSPYYSDADHVREYTLGLLRQHLERNQWNVVYSERRFGVIVMVAKVARSK